MSPEARKAASKPLPSRPKLDARFAYLLSLPAKELKALKEREDAELRAVAKELQAAMQEKEGGEAHQPERVESTRESTSEWAKGAERFHAIERRMFAPLTAGIHFPSKDGWPAGMDQPCASVFIRCEANARDLAELGVRVRSKAGDIVTAFVPLAKVPQLEKLLAVQYIELARPLFPNLSQAVPYAQIDALHNPPAPATPITGAGTIVGIADSVLDIYHPDFRTAANATRLLFLWDQTLTPQAGESPPPTAPALPGFTPAGGASYGVEYSQANIDAALSAYTGTNAYTTVRHGGITSAHGTHVAGIAAGNGLGGAGNRGAAPDAGIIFVSNPNLQSASLLSDSTFVADAFAYIFARAAAAGRPCVANLSNSDNQGPHDGTTLGERFLDTLLETPGRAITLSAGNSNGTSCHAAGSVAAGGTTNLVLNYAANAALSDAIEIWYDGHDRFGVTVTTPGGTVIGPVAPGASSTTALPGVGSVTVTSTLNDPRNGDNWISIIIALNSGQSVPAGNWTIALSGATVINGGFQAWVDRNNRGRSAFQAPLLQENTLTHGVPASGRRPITVGNHDVTSPTPNIFGSSGRGPTRDGRIKPEICAPGGRPGGIQAPRSRNMNSATPGALYTAMAGTSMSAPLVAGACALLFQCRGAGLTWADLKHILAETAFTAGLGVPSNAFGFGSLRMGNACAAPAPHVDVWVRDYPTDPGSEPSVPPGGVFWACPDIEVLDAAGNPTANPTYDPAKRFNCRIRVTVRNLGTQAARNTEVYLYWADPATNIPFPAAWSATGIYTGPPNGPLPSGFPNQGNKIVIPQIGAGGSVPVEFAWAPPAPGGNLRGDDHFCLLVRLENESDSSGIGAGGWAAVTSSNNLGLRNVHVQPDDPSDGDAATTFLVVGSDDADSLVVTPDLAGGRVLLQLPAQALPWRDLRLVQKLGRLRAPFGCCDDDPLAGLALAAKGEEVEALTDITGAEAVAVRDSVALVTGKAGAPIRLPTVRVAEGARMPVRLSLEKARFDKRRRFVHVAQFSGGERAGGVTLELRPKG